MYTIPHKVFQKIEKFTDFKTWYHDTEEKEKIKMQ